MSIKTVINNAVKVLGVLALVVASALLPLLTVNADSIPRFNQMEGDAEFLTGRNLTQNEANFHDPVTAAVDELVRIRVYYHNNATQDSGEPGEAAINTRLKINIPTDSGTAHIVSGVLSADNVEAVSGTIVNGEEVGEANLRIDSNESTTVEYVPGSVRWYPNQNEAGAPVTLPNSQTGNEIISNEGLFLGDINGCWQYSGYVTLEVKLASAGQSNIALAKSAINETQGNVNATTVSANAGDVIRYELTTRNIGDAVAANQPIEDNITDILEYANAVDTTTGTVETRGNQRYIVYAMVNIPAGEQIITTFKVQVKPASEWNGTDFIMTNVYGNVIDVPVTPPTYELKITIDKGVRNLTQSNTEYGYEVTGVKDDDNLEYFILVTNKGEKAITNIIIKDRHDSRLKYQRGSATLTRNGVTTAILDDVLGNGFVLDSALKSGETVKINYRMSADNGANEDRCLVNTATASGEGVGEVSDDASACVIKVDKSVTTTQQPISPDVLTGQPTKLPTTGPVSSSMMLLGLVGSGATTWRYRKAKSALRKAQKDISIL